ncbi:MAG TPA: arginase family protein [Rubrobacteraceae bacterium]|nr:arginase family protein [Rubrobacteraceae bacterium]
MAGDDLSVVVVDAPSNLGLSPPGEGREPGVRGLASALRERGIVTRLGAEDGGVVVPPPYSPEIEPATGTRNGEAIRSFSVDLAERVGKVVGSGRFPLVLGGDCSILVGSMLALRRIGRFGLVFVDGHLDFRHPGNSARLGAAAGEDLALVTGRGSERLTNIEGLRPLVREEDVFALGDREDYPEWRDIHGTGITVWDLRTLKTLGFDEAASMAVEALRMDGVAGFWIHLDADVLDDELMPAVDSRQPGGMNYGELVELLGAFLRSGLAVGMEITIFDPELDPTGEIAEGFTAALVESFSVR